MPQTHPYFDVIVVGSGLAGLSTALQLANSQPKGKRPYQIAIVSKQKLGDGASAWAQGGIAVPLHGADSIQSHLDDTLIAGAGLCEEGSSRFIIEQGRAAIDWLRAHSVPFTMDATNTSEFHLGQEAAHSHRRIVHTADATGHAVIQALIDKVRAHPQIALFETHCVIDLITSHSQHTTQHPSANRCYGLYAFDIASAQTLTLGAQYVVLATGGAGKAYLYTTNPDSATGDGIAIAWRAGCRVANMEFIQFHPTCLYHPYAKSFLISEAVRGEGGILKLPNGERFMLRHDARAELAPRDIVARAIDFELKKHGIDFVYLDITHQSAAFLQHHFPTILARCAQFGIDITRDPIPVVPAAHYTCGGVVTDLEGRTDLEGLYAVGETAYTGLHGANRLASNSLLECVVMGRAAASSIQAAIEQDAHNAASSLSNIPHEPLPEWDESRVDDPHEAVVIAHNWDELRRLMWNYVGIVRTDERLARAQQRIAILQQEVQAYYAHFRIDRDLLELRNLTQVAALIVQSAQGRHESRGLHYNEDWPQTRPKALPTVLSPITCNAKTSLASSSNLAV